MSIAQWIMVCGIVVFGAFVYYMLNREKVDAWVTRVRGTKGAQTAIAEASSIEAAILAHIRQAALVSIVQPAAKAALAKDSTMEDKGIVSAGQLLSGWVLANYDTKTDPVPAKRHADVMYLTQMARKPGGNQVFEDVVLGSQAEINVARNYAHTNGWDPLVTYAPDGGFKDWGAEADPAVKQAAEASIAAYQAAHPRNVHTYDFSRYVPKA